MVPAVKLPPGPEHSATIRWWSRRGSGKLHKETRNHDTGWVEGQLLLSSPKKGTLEAQEGSGTWWGSGNHVPQIQVGSPRTRLSSLSLCVWELTPEWTEFQVRASLCDWFTNLSPPLTSSLCRKKSIFLQKLQWSYCFVSTANIYIYTHEATCLICLIYVQDRSLRCHGILSEKKQAFMHKRITSNLSTYLFNSELWVDREIKRKLKQVDACKMISAGRKEESVPTSTAKPSFGEKSGNYPACASCPHLHDLGSEAMRSVETVKRAPGDWDGTRLRCSQLLLYSRWPTHLSLFFYRTKNITTAQGKTGQKACSTDRRNPAQAEDQELCQCSLGLISCQWQSEISPAT